MLMVHNASSQEARQDVLASQDYVLGGLCVEDVLISQDHVLGSQHYVLGSQVGSVH